jgi:hypothetical protein
MTTVALNAHETLTRPVTDAADAAADYQLAVAALCTAERARADSPCIEREHNVMTAAENVLACRVRACRALIAAGVRVPKESLTFLEVDETLIHLEGCDWLPFAE